MDNSARHVLVIGGGVIGAACAYFLNRSGWRVTLVESGRFGKGCSHGNCGLICPSHVLPLASPGAVQAGLRSLFRPSSPFKIRLRFDPALWGWLFRFARRCNPKDMLEAGQGIKALLDSSRSLYSQLVREEAWDCEWEERGLLFVFATALAMNHYAETDRLMTETFGVSARRLSPESLVELEPALKSGLAGAWLYEHDAHLRPDKLMAAWKKTLEQRGVLLREETKVLHVLQEGSRATGVVSNTGTIKADALVLATGALTPLLGKQLGWRIPIQPGKGYSITMPRPARCPGIPIIFEEHRVAVTPMKSGYRLGSTMEFAGYDDSLNRRRLEYLKDAARLYLHEPYCDPVEEEWCGWRPMTYDGKPIIGLSPSVSNVLIAAGHNTLGMSMAAATGKLVSEMLDGQAPHIDPDPYSPGRF